MGMFVFSGRGPWRRRVTASLAVAAVLLLVVLPAGPASPSVARPLAAQAVPANQAATSAVALVADPGGFDHAFYRGQDGAVYLGTFRDGVWSAQTTIGGSIVGAPAAALAGTTLVVAARGSDGALWLRTRTQGSWGPWQTLGGVIAAAPAVVVDPTGRIDVFVRGINNQVYTRTRPSGGSWSGWAGLGSTVASGPAAVRVGAGGIEVYVARLDHSLWGRSRSAAGWAAWQPLGGTSHSAPAATWNAQTGTTSVFVRGINNVPYLKQGRVGTWTGWQRLGWHRDRRSGRRRHRKRGPRRGRARHGQRALVPLAAQWRLVGLVTGMGAGGSGRTSLLAARRRLDPHSHHRTGGSADVRCRRQRGRHPVDPDHVADQERAGNLLPASGCGTSPPRRTT
jgi:hypothetical protein